MLEGMGFECDEAGDGRVGLDKIRAGPDFDLALVDWNMPVMDGLEMLKGLRAERFVGGR
jgi:two-component system chemotaxis response regulator CheY